MAAFVLPLLDAPNLDKVISTTKVVTGAALKAGSNVSSVGVGIASVFLLFVIFQYATAILDGAKFQLKMLLPLLIYVAVCNFSWVATPVIAFTSSLQKGCVSVVSGQKAAILKDFAHGQECKSLWDAFMVNADRNNPRKSTEDAISGYGGDMSPTGGEGSFAGGAGGGSRTDSSTEAEQAEEEKEKGLQKVINNIGAQLNEWWRGIWQRVTDSFKLSARSAMNFAAWGLPGLIALLMQWLSNIVSFALSSLGSVMTGIIVAFGPVTWAFAVFPGNQRVLGSWVIRLCQFALYAPICQLIDCFCTAACCSIGTKLSDGEQMISLLPLMGALFCNIACLFSVPAIASMIIEGASGSVSLQGGLQSAGRALGDAAKLATFGPRMGYGAAKEITDWQQRMANMKEPQRDQRQMNEMTAQSENIRRLTEHFTGSSASSDSSSAADADGQNTKKNG